MTSLLPALSFSANLLERGSGELPIRSRGYSGRPGGGPFAVARRVPAASGGLRSGSVDPHIQLLPVARDTPPCCTKRHRTRAHEVMELVLELVLDVVAQGPLGEQGCRCHWSRRAQARRVSADIVVVEGLIDAHQLRARGIEDVAALGGTSMRPQAFERLHRRGFESVTFCLDNDDAGRRATVRAVEQSARAADSPTVYVVDPAALAPAKDPDELVRERGSGAWSELLAHRIRGIEWRARELAVGISRESPPAERRAALRRAGQWLGTLPPRLALEQEDALRAVADRCGYSFPAVRRAFQVRFFREHTLERGKADRIAERRPVERAIER
jgi:hypothetical protein